MYGYTALSLDDESTTVPCIQGSTQLVLGDFAREAHRINEARWSCSRDCVMQAGLAHFSLGRCAPSLDLLPKRLWGAKLGEFFANAWRDVRRRRKIGATKARAVAEIFAHLAQALERHPKEARRLRPLAERCAVVECTLASCLEANRVLDEDFLRSELIGPLLEQVTADAGRFISKLAAQRFFVGDSAEGVTQQAIRFGLTRSRIYQLRDVPSTVLETRWPEGFRLWQLAAQQCSPERSSATWQELRTRIDEVFFSSKCEAYWQAVR